MPNHIQALRTIIAVARILDQRPRPKCRDCADENGTCPGTGLPCDLSAAFKAADDALAALSHARSVAPGGLTDEQIESVWDKLLRTHGQHSREGRIAIARAILAATPTTVHPTPADVPAQVVADSIPKGVDAGKQEGSTIPPELWAAVGGIDKCVHHACTWAAGCHEHINDAIAEHNIEDASAWVVRRYVLEQQPLDDAMLFALLEGCTEHPPVRLPPGWVAFARAVERAHGIGATPSEPSAIPTQQEGDNAGSTGQGDAGGVTGAPGGQAE
jgi:hypothetical protein